VLLELKVSKVLRVLWVHKGHKVLKEVKVSKGQLVL
jgi:hypothetical protein